MILIESSFLIARFLAFNLQYTTAEFGWIWRCLAQCWAFVSSMRGLSNCCCTLWHDSLHCWCTYDLRTAASTVTSCLLSRNFVFACVSNIHICRICVERFKCAWSTKIIWTFQYLSHIKGACSVCCPTELADITHKLIVFRNLMKFTIKALPPIWVTNNVLSKTTNCTVLTSDELILSMKIAFPDKLLIALARWWWNPWPDWVSMLT